MASSETIRLAGEPMQLLADRALYWPRRSRLLIADLHLGKSDIFRSAGLALPKGDTANDLARLSRLLAATGAAELVVLGDFLHGPRGQRDWQQDWHAWRAQHAALHIVVVAGNHDRALGDGADLGVTVCLGTLHDAPFGMQHEPVAVSGTHVLCGHLHPVVRIPSLPGRWPGFWLREHSTVLPAFSRFTGGVVPRFERSESFVACADGELLSMKKGAVRPPFQ